MNEESHEPNEVRDNTAGLPVTGTPAEYGMPAVGDELHVDPLAPGAGTPLTATITSVPEESVARYALVLGDDALLMAQRLGELVAHGPELEEDVALTNIALDQLGAARLFLQYAGRGLGRTEDELAYFREEAKFRSCGLVEQPNGDFAHQIVKVLAFALYQRQLYARLAGSSDEFLAAVAVKSAKEVAYHLEHARLWTLRLGDGTAESRRRMVEALADLWPYLDELFDPGFLSRGHPGGSSSAAAGAGSDLLAAGVAVDPSELRAPFFSELEAILAEATLDPPEVPFARGAGRLGVHTPHLGFVLAEMQSLARKHPGASW